MADSERLKAWLLDHSGNLNLRLTQFDWFHDWGLKNFYDLQISVEIGGRTFIGRGTATSENGAVIKAGAEALERAYSGGNQIHSTGVAAHTLDEMAKANARLELNERAAFFGHFFTETPFARRHESHWSHLKIQYPGAFEKLNSFKTEIGFYSTTNKNGIPTFVCIATGLAAKSSWGGVIGLSAKNETDQAIQSAFFECLRGVAALHILGENKTLTEYEFLRIKNPTSSDRQKLARNIDYWKSIGHLFPSEPSEINLDGGRDLFSSHVQALSCPYEEIKTAPLYVYLAAPHVSGDLNSLFENSDPITLNWLSDFFGQTITQTQVMRRPHFLG